MRPPRRTRPCWTQMREGIAMESRTLYLPAAGIRRRPSRTGSRTAAGRRRRSRGMLVPWLYLAPALILLCIWVYYPLLRTFT